MRWRIVFVNVFLVTVFSVDGFGSPGQDFRGYGVVINVFKDCYRSNDKYSCFADKAANALERSMNWDIPLLQGMRFKRNQVQFNDTKASEARALSSFERLSTAVGRFISSHSLSLTFNHLDDQIEGRSLRDGDGGGGGGGNKGGGGGGGDGGLGFGSLGMNRKDIKKEAKYMKYAFMVLLGIFGLTGPIVMKTLAIMAGKALLASKAALLIVGGVALKKIFEHNDHHEKTSVKVHHIPVDEHDSHDRQGYNYITSYNGYNNPYEPYLPYSYYSRASKQLEDEDYKTE